MSSLLTAFTIFHVLLSLVGIATGFVVILAMLRGHRPTMLTAVFLGTTLATTVTGFMFPSYANGLTPAHKLGFIALAANIMAVVALYQQHLAGRWRTAYVLSAIFSQYLDVFVLILQSFQKVPFLHTLAPTQTNEPAFLVAQTVALVVFIALAVMAPKKFRAA
jgi:hypothetical protein